jgi:hypothetical protein
MSTESSGKVKIGVSHFRFSAVLAAVLAILAMGPPSASATPPPPFKCGQVLDMRSSYTLTNDVGPCTGVALTISNDNGYAPIVLYLNGYRIFGKIAAPGQVGVQLDIDETVSGGPRISRENGPGTITGFDIGIDLVYDHNTVGGVVLTRNNTGVLSELGGNDIGGNTLKGNFCLGIGSYPSQINPDSIFNNLIARSTGSSACSGGGVGIDIGGGGNGNYGVGVWGNVVRGNTTGMNADLTGLSILVSSNVFSRNLLSGASIQNFNREFGGLDVSGNLFDNNGQDGLLLTDVNNGAAIQNNFAYANRRYGIALVNSDSTGYTPDQLTGNTALGNGKYDLYCSGSPGNNWVGPPTNTYNSWGPTLPFPTCP